jgi:cell wall-associated NlpC family hydrolase
MPINRTTAAVLLAAAAIPALAAVPLKPEPSCVEAASAALYSLQIAADPDDAVAAIGAPAAARDDPAAGTTSAADVAYARELLAAYAMALSNIRYHRGGRAPKTGFDCSGFVQYVFAHALGVDLPGNSASQYRFGTKVPRAELRTGDLVFFHTHGKRVSHVGIYLDHGHFIHSPSPGKRVRIDDLHKHYWATRFMGARRPDTFT